MSELDINRRPWREIAAVVLHDLMALRSAVFVLEQNCAYLDLDGRDVEPSTEHLWTSDDQGPTAYLRVLAEPDGSIRVGRVCTRADARGAGLAAALLADVVAGVDAAGGRVVVLEAQAHLEGWYGRFGFTVTGPGYIEDGIPHLPMRRGPALSEASTPAR